MDRNTAASYALLTMYSYDSCYPEIHQIPPLQIDPRVTNAGYQLLGWLTGNDQILSQTLGEIQRFFGMGPDTSCYGYVASNGQEILVAIRGTIGLAEWIDDADFWMDYYPNDPDNKSLVDEGFWRIYSSMKFISDVSTDGQDLVTSLVTLANQKNLPITVTGHSLGAALATYLALDLNLRGAKVKACMFASPKTGDANFVNFFEAHVPNYDVFNYARDIVPQNPDHAFDHLTPYQSLIQAKTIPASDIIQDSIPCDHHLICYTALLNYNLYQQAVADTHFTTQDQSNRQGCVIG